jgi:thiamine biosynthesis lipoprotein
VAPTCVVANTVSTAGIVKGIAGLAWLKETGLPVRVLAPDGTVFRYNGWHEEA